ncbi:MAG: phrA [Verrucomicrobiales bacterium]|nr:phrA [Verrucomicrobiales bacterium]
MGSPTLVWFRQDLRLADHPALRAACERGAVIPVFIWSPEEDGEWLLGGASKWWLHQSLKSLTQELERLESKLVIRRGNALDQLRALVHETKATALFWNRRYEPTILERDKKIEEHFGCDDFAIETFNSHLLLEPWAIQNKSGKPFQVFTPYWKTCLAAIEAAGPGKPIVAPKKIEAPIKWPKSLGLDELELQPKIDWVKGIRENWQPGEQGAQGNLKRFLSETVFNYAETRNRPDVVGTSRLSPHLHFGEISPRQILHAVKMAAEKKFISPAVWRQWQFLTELGWREFAHHLLFHFPHTANEPLRPEFKKFPWHDNPEGLKAWQLGRTGYPIVDAGMRELWHTGWMHNRVRMIVASFLVKDLLLPWHTGAKWFWDTLVDADLANNTLGWQWTAGCGADAAPFFRIFNPVTQGEKFDPKGDYVRRWVPEIARLPDKWLHQPWNAPREILSASRIDLGKTYPEPIVQHSIARDVALEAFQKIKSQETM